MSKNKKFNVNKLLGITFLTGTLALGAGTAYVKGDMVVNPYDTLNIRNSGIYELENGIKELQNKYKIMEADLKIAHNIKIEELHKIKQEKLKKEKERIEREKTKEKNLALASRGGVRQNSEKVLFEVTMYTNEGGGRPKGDPNYGRMANGEFTHKGALAAPKDIPMGSKINLNSSVPGWEHITNREYTVKDRGGAIKRKTEGGQEIIIIDIYTDSKTEALNWGRRRVEGYLTY